ncbi:acyl carrier protein [candidate division WOR-3 bacterium]|nr:acyl carrier protein [candidate division WOR-3 bacterium]
MSVFEKMKRIIAEELDVKETEVLPESSFTDDLGADSLGYIVLLQALEEEFNIQIPDTDTAKLKTVGDAVKYIKDRVNNEG